MSNKYCDTRHCFHSIILSAEWRTLILLSLFVISGSRVRLIETYWGVVVLPDFKILLMPIINSCSFFRTPFCRGGSK